MQKRCCWYWMYRTQRKRSCEGDTVPWLASGKAMVLMMVVVEVVVVVAVVGKGVVVGASGWEDKYMWNIRWGRGHMGKNTVWKKKLCSKIMLTLPDVWPAASCVMDLLAATLTKTIHQIKHTKRRHHNTWAHPTLNELIKDVAENTFLSCLHAVTQNGADGWELPGC